MTKITRLILIFLILLVPSSALAHCPLCTVGAGALAAFAAYLGVSAFSIGIFIGAFALAMGLWIARLIPKKFPFKSIILGFFSFLLTIIPLMPLMPSYFSYYLSIGGDYGSIFNRTYFVSQFLVGSIMGGFILILSPYISSYLTSMRKKAHLPFQGIAITFILLTLVTLLFEFFL